MVVPHHPRLREGLRDAVVMSDADLPKIAAPAVRALASIGITRLDQVANQSESELLASTVSVHAPSAFSTRPWKREVSPCAAE